MFEDGAKRSLALVSKVLMAPLDGLTNVQKLALFVRS